MSSFSGELTRAGFIDEYKKLYPKYLCFEFIFEIDSYFDISSGNPKPYCDYIFKAIDRDRSGMINFVEFTEAVALTQLNDFNIRLKLVC